MAEFKDDGIEIRVVTPEDADGLRKGVYSLMSEEPVARALCMKVPEDLDLGLDELIPLYVSSGLSLVAEDTNTKELVGFRMSISETRKGIEEMKGKYLFDPEKMPVLNRLERMVHIIEKHPTFMMDYYNTDEIVHFFGLHVIPTYCKRGIASRLVLAAINVAKERGYKYIRCEATSNYSRKIFENVGCETLNEITYDDFRNMGFVLADTGVHKKYTQHGLKIADD